MSYTINSGRDYGDLEWRLKQMQADMNIIWNRLDELEAARDEKVEPDAGEPANQYFVDCLKENAKLIEENDVLRYQYEAMKNETARCKSQLDQFEKIVADMQKVLEMTMDQRDEYGKTLIRLKNENEQLKEDVRGAHERVKELDKPYAPSIKESSTYWQQRYNEQLQTTDILYKELDFFRKMTHDLEMEKTDAKWYKEQAIKKCIDIVERIKNDPLTGGECKRWMVAICEDIQQAIKKEFGVK